MFPPALLPWIQGLTMLASSLTSTLFRLASFFMTFILFTCLPAIGIALGFISFPWFICIYCPFYYMRGCYKKVNPAAAVRPEAEI